MFRPNTDCLVQKVSGKTDVYGMPIPGAKQKDRCAVIKMIVKNEKSAVRADTSASRGNARELEADAVFLMPKTTTAEIDDLIIVLGHEFRIASKFPRQDLQGRLDHYEIACTYWSAR